MKTLEQKAKAYDEAIEKARIWKDKSGMPKDKQGILDNIFPELKETEDERIRKAIIALLNTTVEGKKLYSIADTTRSEMVNWLEKQGQVRCTGVGKKEEAGVLKKMLNLEKEMITPEESLGIDSETYNKIVDECIYGDEQKPSDKKPKFKVGDFLVNDYCMGRVVELADDAYLLDTEQGIPFSCEHNAHLWTIQDAKDGDILVCGKDKLPFIFKGFLDRFHPDCPVAYCGICEDGIFSVSSGDGWWTDKEVFPANKKQREQLEKAITDAGYIWDAEKRELKEIEQKPTDEEMKTLLRTEYEKGRADAIAEMQKSAWSEEDEEIKRTIISDGIRGAELDSLQICWLKSLKDRVQPQPKQEWSEEDEEHIKSLLERLEGMCKKDATFIRTKFAVSEDEDWLKSLRPHSQWKPSDRDIKLLRELSDGKICPDNYRTRLYEIINNLKFL